MAYLHCHDCNWSQDDFWDFTKGKYGWGYNPIKYYLGTLFGKRGYLRPRMIEWDSQLAKDRGWKSPYRHSWFAVIDGFVGMVKHFWYQKWWFYSSVKKRYINGTLLCPNCKSSNMDID